MVATLTFNLPEENDEHRMAVDAPRYYSALFDFKELLRQKMKQGDKPPTWEGIQDFLVEILDTNNVHLDDIR
jgi:hypothetical protein